jgi:hypothetical protein
VNREFANHTLAALRRAVRELDEQERLETCPVVWIHDYQLLVAATTIRQVRFTTASQWTTSRASSIQTITSELISRRSVLILSSQVGSSLLLVFREKVYTSYSFHV